MGVAIVGILLSDGMGDLGGFVRVVTGEVDSDEAGATHRFKGQVLFQHGQCLRDFQLSAVALAPSVMECERLDNLA